VLWTPYSDGFDINRWLFDMEDYLTGHLMFQRDDPFTLAGLSSGAD